MRCQMIKFLFIVITFSCQTSYAYNTARLVRLEILVSDQFKTSFGYNEEVFLKFTERTEKHGFESELHTVTTVDGYILTIFRFKKRHQCKRLKQPPVIFQHGASGNAISWLDPGPANGLPYLLANECFDMWLTNSRGTSFSRNHTHFNPDKDPEYWQFSHHEMGIYDNPAIIDYILNKTGSDKINHISHSQGSATLLIMGSMRPEYLDKVNAAIFLAPASWMTHVNPLIRLLAYNWKCLYSLVDGVGIQEPIHTHSIIQEALLFICRSKSYYPSKFCLFWFSIFSGSSQDSIDPETLSVVFAHTPDGFSLKNLVHEAQIVTSKEFQQFDYETENIKYYGQNTPPKYDLSKIEIPVSIIYSEDDQIVNHEDVKTLHKHLKNVPVFYKIRHPSWSHIDFAWSKRIPKYLFPKLNKLLNRYTYTDTDMDFENTF